jgi:hypothetical protein
VSAITTAIELASVTLLGLAAGAMAAEGAILVPFWRAMPPQAFLAWYREHAQALIRFYAPIEVGAGVTTIAAAVSSWLAGGAASVLWIAAALAIFGVLLAFPIYFQRVNASFADGTIAVGGLPAELRRWSAWHWARVALGTAAFVLAAIASGRP